MKAPVIRAAERAGRAFTMLELLTATAVMVLLLALLLQIANHTLQASRLTSQQLDSTQSARRAIDVISSDLANAVTTDGAAILFQTSPQLAFLTRERGPGKTPARFLAVGYRLDTSNRLFRNYAAVPWISTDFLGAAANIGSSSELATGILQFTVVAQLDDGSIQPLGNLPSSATVDSGDTYGNNKVPAVWSALVPPGLSPDNAQPKVKSLLIAMASVDGQTFALLSDTQRKLFTQPVNPEDLKDPVRFWEGILQNASLPGSARSSIRFNSKTIRLP